MFDTLFYQTMPAKPRGVLGGGWTPPRNVASGHSKRLATEKDEKERKREDSKRAEKDKVRVHEPAPRNLAPGT